MARGAGARGSGFRLTALESFSGGLNLRSDQFNLAPNESPDLLNVAGTPASGRSSAEIMLNRVHRMTIIWRL